MHEFIHVFFGPDGTIHTSAECVNYLVDIAGFSLQQAKGILGLAVARGYISVVMESKYYKAYVC